MFIDVIKLANNVLTVKIGSTESECLGSRAIDLPVVSTADFYTILFDNRDKIERHLMQVEPGQLIKFKYPDGNIPITKL